MSTTSKSPKRVLAVAYRIGCAALAPYAHRSSPKKFTQPQLFACLVLKEFLQLDYRKLAALLSDCTELAATIELHAIPHFTTFQKAAERLLSIRPVRRLLEASLGQARQQRKLGKRSHLAALDGTGWESHHASDYFVRRRAKGGKTWQNTTYRRFPKAGLLCDCRSHLILALVPGRGPAPDVPHFHAALDDALSRIAITTLVADAGYDAEHVHEYAREECGVNTFIPAKIGRPTAKPPSGFWRRRMARWLYLTRYTQRWQVETVNSMLKRLLGSALRARRYHSQCRELCLRAITLNVMILRRSRVFYGAGQNCLCCAPSRCAIASRGELWCGWTQAASVGFVGAREYFGLVAAA
ncbi:MAG: transposase [Pirellulales bacterium]|nr:transposase [Pirellulales bacterium]